MIKKFLQIPMIYLYVILLVVSNCITGFACNDYVLSDIPLRTVYKKYSTSEKVQQYYGPRYKTVQIEDGTERVYNGVWIGDQPVSIERPKYREETRLLGEARFFIDGPEKKAHGVCAGLCLVILPRILETTVLLLGTVARNNFKITMAASAMTCFTTMWELGWEYAHDESEVGQILVGSWPGLLKSACVITATVLNLKDHENDCRGTCFILLLASTAMSALKHLKILQIFKWD